MDDLDDKIKRLLGEAIVPPLLASEEQYHSAFDESGVAKADDIISALSAEKIDLKRFAYLSIGGSSGAEILHVLSNTSMEYGVLLEYDDAAGALAEKKAKDLIPSKTLRVLRGDATQKIETCRRILLDLRDNGKIDGIVCSVQAVLHELPTRSPKHELEYLLGEALWDWNPCFFFCREPCSPQTWPEKVKLSVGNLSSERLEALANHIRGMLSMPGEVRRAGPRFILLHKDLAVELLFKIFYIDDYSYEIDERVTSLNPLLVAKVVEGILEGGEVRSEYLNSGSFEKLYRKFQVMAKDHNETPLRPPLTFVRIYAKRLIGHEQQAIDNSQENSSKNEHNKIGTKSVKTQAERLLNLSLLPWSPRKSPSLRVLWPELLVDPELLPHKNSTTADRLTNWVKFLHWNSNVALIGAPGAGKSTSLRRLFLDLAAKIDLPNSPFPVFGHVSDYVQYIDSQQSSYPLEIAISEARLSQKPIIYFVDGLDEIDSILVDRFFSEFIQNFQTTEFIWCACRTEYFFNQLGAQIKYTQHFREVLEFCPWSETDTLWFVKMYSDRLEIPELPSRFNRLLLSTPEASEFSNNPFHLTLILYLLGENIETDNAFTNAYSLYNNFYNHWLRREAHRGTSSADESEVRSFHIQIAENLFDLRGAVKGRTVLLDKPTKTMIESHTAAADLLRVERFPDRISGFRHETIGEFLLANNIIEALSDRNTKLDNVLLRTYTYEINRFVREAISLIDENGREYLIKLLSERYKEYLNDMESELSKCQEDISPTLRIREQLLYYIGRIPCLEFPEILRISYQSEHHSLLVRIAALGSILHGNEDIEMDYIEKLSPGSSWDIENRSVQLVYFGDVYGDIYHFTDNGLYSWDRTREAILARLKGNSIRDQRLRWWDLRTIMLFAVSRMNGFKFTAREKEIIRTTFIDHSISSNDRIQRIQDEIRIIEEKFKEDK